MPAGTYRVGPQLRETAIIAAGQVDSYVDGLINGLLPRLAGDTDEVLEWLTPRRIDGADSSYGLCRETRADNESV